MTHTTNPRPIRTRRLVALALASAAALGACGDDDGESAPTTNAAAASSGGDPAESAYCDTAREFAVHMLAPRDEGNPTWLRTYMDEYVAFVDEAASEAPDELADEWTLSSDGLKTTVIPVLEKYGYDIERIMAEGTPEEQAVSEPSPDVAAAQATILEYEAMTCGSAQPAAADVEFAGPTVAAYCEASATLDGAFGEAIAAENSPAAMEQLLSSDEWTQLMSTMESSAPDEIKADVIAINAWDREKKIPLTGRYDYDIRRLLLEGTAAERAVLQSTDPAIREHYARVAAYEQQLCEGS
jgi:hypothetical protein